MLRECELADKCQSVPLVSGLSKLLAIVSIYRIGILRLLSVIPHNELVGKAEVDNFVSPRNLNDSLLRIESMILLCHLIDNSRNPHMVSRYESQWTIDSLRTVLLHAKLY